MQNSEQIQGQRTGVRARPRTQRSNNVWDIPGFLPKSKVTTSFGNMPIEGLRLRDPVMMKSGAYRRVEWIDKIHVDADFLSCFPDAYPIVVGQDAFVRNSPPRDLHISPVQQVLFPKEWQKPTSKMAKDFLGRPGIHRSHTPNFTYYLFHCGQPDYALVDELWCFTTP